MATNSQGNSKVKTVSMDADLGERAEARQKNLKLRSFSAYVQRLIINDLSDGGNLVMREDLQPAPHPGRPEGNVKYGSARKKSKKRTRRPNSGQKAFGKIVSDLEKEDGHTSGDAGPAK